MLDNETLRRQLVSRRAFMLGIGKFSLLSLLAGKMFYTQLLKNDKYKTLSDKNRISMLLVHPPRGQIFDRNGELIAGNRQCFRLMLDKGSSQNYLKDLNLVYNLLELDQEQREIIEQRIKKGNRRMPIMILDQISWQQISIIEENKHSISSILIDLGYSRNYLYGSITAHLVGYLGLMNEKEREKYELQNIGECNIGKVGLENYYENELRGEFGYKQMEINAYGKYVRQLTHLKSIPGEDLHLNIDVNLQVSIQPYLNKFGCSAIAMNVENGEVVFLATNPSFEPNNFIKLSGEYWNSLINDPYKPLVNKAINSNYPPGSIFKIIPILAALEYGIDPVKTFNCKGEPFLGGNSFRCSSKTGHGSVDMYDAIKYSCNTYMYEIGKIIGPEKILEVADKFHFGKRTGIDMPGEAEGFLPSLKWKKDKFKREWTLGDTCNLAIGQGFLLSTPIQMARFAAAIANDGKLLRPTIVKKAAVIEKIDVSQKHLDIIKEAMHRAVNTPGGTAYYSRITDPLREIAGKTGTAQVQAKRNADDDLNRESIAWHRRNHAVYCGFGPAHKPAYAVAVLVDHGGGGGRAAAPIGSKILAELI